MAFAVYYSSNLYAETTAIMEYAFGQYGIIWKKTVALLKAKLIFIVPPMTE